MAFLIRPIAYVRSTRAEPTDDHWDAERSTIELTADVPAAALMGLDTFSHVEVVAVADRAEDVPPAPWVRHPRGNPAWPELGIFANRNKDRPNRLLVSVAQVAGVEGRTLHVRGLDLIDGTPVVDLKPWFRWSGPRGAVHAAPWSDELGAGYF